MKKELTKSRKVRVAQLIRVSDKKQTKSTEKKNRAGKKRSMVLKPEEDLPIQRGKIRDTIEKYADQGWEVAKDSNGNIIEYIEGGVSAYYTPMSRRDMVTKAFEDGKNRLYDLLIVYKLDRFGRRREAFDFAMKFVENGIRLYDATRDSEFTEKDELNNFFEFHMAKRASKDTKDRVTDAMNVMHNYGLWTGGVTPYGYIENGEWAGKLDIEDDEAKIVRMMFDMYTEQGLGQQKISAYLNTHGFRSREGGMFRATQIAKILRNPIYKGYLAYNKTVSAQGEFGRVQKRVREEDWDINPNRLDDLVIVSEEQWEQAKEIREGRRIVIESDDDEDYTRSMPKRMGTGELILVGLTSCGCCGGRMVSKWQTKTNAAGERIRKGYYMCWNRRESGKAACNTAKPTIAKERLEEAVMSEIMKFSRELAGSSLLNDVQALAESSQNKFDAERDELEKRLASVKKRKQNLQRDIAKLYEQDDPNEDWQKELEELSKKTNQELAELTKRLDELSSTSGQNAMTADDVLTMKRIIEDWGSLYGAATIEGKKSMLKYIVDRVVVYEDKAVVSINLRWIEFFEATSQIVKAASELASSEEAFNTLSARLCYVHPQARG